MLNFYKSSKKSPNPSLQGKKQTNIPNLDILRQLERLKNWGKNTSHHTNKQNQEEGCITSLLELGRMIFQLKWRKRDSPERINAKNKERVKKLIDHYPPLMRRNAYIDSGADKGTGAVTHLLESFTNYLSPHITVRILKVPLKRISKWISRNFHNRQRNVLQKLGGGASVDT